MGFLKFILKYHLLLLFILFETISLILVIESNDRKKALFVHSANSVTGTLDEWVSRQTAYFHLKEENERLKQENLLLRKYLPIYYKSNTNTYSVLDTTYLHQYLFHSARVIKNSTHLRSNYLVINKGTNQGIEKDMAVIGPEGIVGLIIKTNRHYSLAISLLNTQFSVSAKLSDNNYFGTLSWPGNDYKYALLSDIPNHININKGDTVSTTGYSAFFPPDTPIGTVETYELQEGQNFYAIKVRLATDFKQTSFVYLVKNRLRAESEELIKEEEN